MQTEITVLPADTHKNLRLGWKCYERKGMDLFNLSEPFRDGASLGDFASLDALLTVKWEKKSYDKDRNLVIQYPLPGIRSGKVAIPLARRLFVGDEITTSCGGISKVTELDGRKGQAENGGSLWLLEFDEEEGWEFWCCTMFINKECLDKLQLDMYKSEQAKATT